MSQEFSTGLCACFDDMEICCYSFSNPAFSNASAYAKATGGDWCQMCALTSFFPICATTYTRMKVREAYNIKGNCFIDFLCATYCLPCSTAQLWREFAVKGPGSQAMK